MAVTNQKIGWIGMGRMGYPMAERLVKAGYDVSIWNRTKSKAEPLAKIGAKIVDKLADLAGVDVRVLDRLGRQGPREVYFGKDGVVSTGGKTAERSSSTARPSRSRNRPRSASGSRSAAPTSSARRSAATPR